MKKSSRVALFKARHTYGNQWMKWMKKNTMMVMVVIKGHFFQLESLSGWLDAALAVDYGQQTTKTKSKKQNLPLHKISIQLSPRINKKNQPNGQIELTFFFGKIYSNQNIHKNSFKHYGWIFMIYFFCFFPYSVCVWWKLHSGFQNETHTYFIHLWGEVKQGPKKVFFLSFFNVCKMLNEKFACIFFISR